MAKSQKKKRDHFASAALVALIVQSLRQSDPDLLPSDVKEPDYLAAATFSADEKRRILEFAFSAGGPGPILAIGAQRDRFPSTPTIATLLNSAHADVVAQKWQRLEKYHHSTNRTAIDCRPSNTWQCRRYTVDESAIAAPENLFVCGLMVGLLKAFGCRQVRCRIGELEFGASESIKGVWPSGARTDHWQIRWRGAAEERPRAEDALGAGEPASERLSSVLQRDIGRVWKLDEAARALARSTRSLQRDLKERGHTFSSVVRGARASAAGRLLASTAMPLSEVGYCCGYADQAHFQRDFQRAVNLTPLQYRRISQAGSDATSE
jgi:AraC-like DNA-binding protein